MNCKVIFLFLIYLISISAFSQQTKIDSLESELKTAHRGNKTSILNQLSELLRRDTSKAIAYAKEALIIAEQTGDKKASILALKNIGISYGFNNQYDKALSHLLQAFALAEKSKEWTLAGDNGLNIGSIYYVILSNYDRALEYYLKSLELYEKTNNQKGIASALSGLGITYCHEKKHDAALETLFKSLSIYESIDEEREIPKIYVNIGTAYKEMGSYEKAFEFFSLAVKGFNETNNSRGKAHALYITGDLTGS
jgi:tetratricopeptide (TPR) repeat protein